MRCLVTLDDYDVTLTPDTDVYAAVTSLRHYAYVAYAEMAEIWLRW